MHASSKVGYLSMWRQCATNAPFVDLHGNLGMHIHILNQYLCIHLDLHRGRLDAWVLMYTCPSCSSSSYWFPHICKSIVWPLLCFFHLLINFYGRCRALLQFLHTFNVPHNVMANYLHPLTMVKLVESSYGGRTIEMDPI